MLSAPTRTAPAASMRAISGESFAAGGCARLILEPATVASPAMSKRFFTAKGTPASGSLDLSDASIFLACARARSGVTAVKELSAGLSFAMRESAASVTLDALAAPEATARAISEELDQLKSSAISDIEDRRGFGGVGQFEIRDH